MVRFAPLSVLLLAACSPSYSPDTYASSAVQQASKVEQGIIVGVRQVGVQAAGTTGAVTGAAAGGLAGNQLPMGSAFTTLGGGLVGGLVGTGIERATGDTKAYEYIVRKVGNELVSVTQKDPAPLVLGQKVLVIAGSQARIVPDYTTAPETPKPDIVKKEPAATAVPEPEPPPPPAFTAPSFTPIE